MKKTKKIKKTNQNVARIKVVGIGGAGGNAVSRMVDYGMRGVEFIAINTDAQDLDAASPRKKIHIGKNTTHGLGAGMNPDLGRQAAEENRQEIVEALRGADLVFLTAGLGGGTGSGGIPVVAEAAQEVGALTLAVVTKPFSFEGAQRSRIANEALVKLKEKVDTFIVVPNDRIFAIIDKDTPTMKAFELIDEVLHSSVRGVTELLSMTGFINIDFADVKAVTQSAGSALVGIGTATGKDRATEAVTQALHSPLLETAMDGARGILFSVAGGRDLKMSEVNEIAKAVSDMADPTAKIIFGTYHDRSLKKGEIKVTVIATGFNGRNSSRGIEMVNASSLFAPISPESDEKKSEIPMFDSKLVAKSGMKHDIPPVKTQEKSAPKKNVQDTWDIPAFLRKKRK